MKEELDKIIAFLLLTASIGLQSAAMVMVKVVETLGWLEDASLDMAEAFNQSGTMVTNKARAIIARYKIS